MIRQCTRCDLRFRSEGELREHLSVDHDADTSVLERYRYRGSHEQEPLYPDLAEGGQARRRILVVANQTLRERPLLDAIASRLEDGPAEIVVVAPATHSADYPSSAEEDAEDGVTRATDDRGEAQARWRLRQVIEDLRAQGVEAAGQLGSPDPYEAAGRVLETARVDEVLFSTLPPGLSRWFGLDVPARLRRRFRVPVTVVTADPESDAVPS
jgi:hypothetical protein